MTMTLKARLLAIRDIMRMPTAELEQREADARADANRTLLEAATSPTGVTHVSDPAVGQAILEALKRSGVIPHGATAAVRVTGGTIGPGGQMIPDRPGMTETWRPGSKPPSDPQTDGMTWSVWHKTMGELAYPGWSPCRFVNRQGTDAAGFVFGVTKGDYGIWECPFYTCDEADEERDGTEQILACLTYLPTGFGLGIFANRDTANEGAEIAAAMGGWDQLPYDDNTTPSVIALWKEHIARMHQNWEFHGIDWDTTRHAHQQGPHSVSMGIWTKTAANLIAGKPEKAS
jgi:hypothetical protein